MAAFEHSSYADDWRELMRLYLVRRTRSFIQENYAETDDNGRTFLTFEDGTRSYFPVRRPVTVPFTIDETNPHDPYARLYADEVVDAYVARQTTREAKSRPTDHRHIRSRHLTRNRGA